MYDNASYTSKFRVKNNIGFRIHYDKIFKPEYLPSRIRYNSFFFYAGLGMFLYWLKPHVSIRICIVKYLSRLSANNRLLFVCRNSISLMRA